MKARRPGDIVGGRYALLCPLASGGMGAVWVATHRQLEIEVAIKFVAPGLLSSPGARARFEREAKVAARLGSQHVVQVLDYGVEDGTPYMVMELLKGESLSARLARERRLPLPLVARLVVQIAKALRTAHDAGLVHRDLKPANVFLARKDDDEVVKVLDFGIAKATSLGDVQAETASGIMLGSIHYMSPEQVRSSRTVDRRSDLWSLGVILYRALTGRLPFPGDLCDVLSGICAGHVPPPSSVAPDLSPAVDAFFARAFAIDVDERFASARELAEAFCTLTLQAPPAPSSHPPAPQLRRTLRMNGPSGTVRLPAGAISAPEADGADDAPTLYMPHHIPRLAFEVLAPRGRATPGAPALDSTAPTSMQSTRTAPDAAVEHAPDRSVWLTAVAVVMAACAGLLYGALGPRLAGRPAPAAALVVAESPAPAAPPRAAASSDAGPEATLAPGGR